MSTPFRCPACNFTVFNRRVARCEKCGADLPPAFRFSPKDLTWLAEEEARLERARKDLQREAEEMERKRRQRLGDGG